MAHILLVEDEVWLGDLYQKMLLQAGHSVAWCRDAYVAIEAVDQHRPAVIVLDLLLPWGNGLQFLHELASHTDLGDIQVVLCSNALPKEITVANLQHYNVAAIVDKTTDPPQRLKQVINELIDYASLSN